MESAGAYLIAIFAIILFTAYGFIFLRRGIKYLKMKDARYVDEDILDFLETSIKVIWGLVVLFACLALLGLAWGWFWDNIWLRMTFDPVTGRGYIVPFMSCVFVVVIVGLLIKVVHCVLQYNAGNLKAKPKKPMNPRVALLIELFIKYFLIAFGVILIVTIGLTTVGYYDMIVGGLLTWLSKNKTRLIFIAFVVILGGFFIRVFDTFFGDMKKKETTFSPQIMDVARISSRYFIYLIIGIVLLYSSMQMFELQETGMILVVVIIVCLGIIGAIAATSNLRNAMSGIILMMLRPFEEGDRVRILEGTTCDIKSIGIIFTRVRTLRGEVVDVPNNEIVNKPILNFSRSKDYTVSITVTVPHTADMNIVKELLTKAVQATEHVDKTRPPKIYAIGMDHDRTTLEVLVYTNYHKRMRRIKSELLHNISGALRSKDILCSVHIADREEVERMRGPKNHIVEEERHRLGP